MSRFTLLTAASVLVLSTIISGCGRDEPVPQENQAESVDDTNVIVPSSTEGLEKDPNASLEDEEAGAEGEAMESDNPDADMATDVAEVTEESANEPVAEVTDESVTEEVAEVIEEGAEAEVAMEETAEEVVAEVEEPAEEEAVVVDMPEVTEEAVAEVEAISEEAVEEVAEVVTEEELAEVVNEEMVEEPAVAMTDAEPETVEAVVPAPVIPEEEVLQADTTPPADALALQEGTTTLSDLPATVAKTRTQAENALTVDELVPIMEAQDSIDATLEEAYAIVARMQNEWTQDQYVAFIEESQITTLQNLRRKLSKHLGAVSHRQSFFVAQ